MGPVPSWDEETQELRVGKTLIRRFEHPATLVGAVLAEFQKSGWPRCIKNPFAGKAGAKHRLREARKLLNRYQKWIEFACVNGSAAMTWQWRDDSAPLVRPHPGH
jgi:hypothetical protein